MNLLEKWEAYGVISLRSPQHAQCEVEAAGRKQQNKALNRLVLYACITTNDERETLSAIEEVLQRERRARCHTTTEWTH
jgi:hypothetical protein